MNSHMMYHMFSPERVHVRPARFAGKGGYRRQRQQEYRPREEVMTFSAEFAPEWLVEREDQGPVYAPQRRNPLRTTTQPQTIQPVSAFDTGRVVPASREGLRAPVAAVLAMLLLVVIGVVSLSYHIRIKAINDLHNANLSSITALEKRAGELQAEISAMMSESQIANAALALGMQRVRSSDRIYLTIPEDVVCSLPTDATMGGGYYAAIPGD